MSRADEIARRIVHLLTGDPEPRRPEIVALIATFGNERYAAGLERAAISKPFTLGQVAGSMLI